MTKTVAKVTAKLNTYTRCRFARETFVRFPYFALHVASNERAVLENDRQEHGRIENHTAIGNAVPSVARIGRGPTIIAGALASGIPASRSADLRTCQLNRCVRASIVAKTPLEGSPGKQ